MSIAWEAGVRDAARLAALERSGLVGTGPEDAFDRLTELATELTGAPLGCITLVDAERSTCKSSVGIPECGPRFLPVEQSFCRLVVGSGRPLIVDDVRRDPRTCGDPAAGLFGITAWAGYPIQDAGGAVLGTFCLMDFSPHEWTAKDLHVLATLAMAASSEIALRRSQAEAMVARQEADVLRSAAERDQVALVTHLHELIALGEPTAAAGRSMLAWFGAPDASSTEPRP